MSTFAPDGDFAVSVNNISDKAFAFEELSDNNVWAREPLAWGIVTYSIAIPLICTFGIIGNSVILLVLKGKSLKESTYTYLTVLAAADLVTCILLLFSGLARGVFWKKSSWMEFDAFVHIPLATISSNIAVLAAVAVAVDRLVIVIGPVKCYQPKFCRKSVARKLMGFSIFASTVIDIPYFFIYTHDKNGNIVGSKMSLSRYYDALNWIQLVVFGLIPAIFLLISNAVLIFTVRRTIRQRELLLKCRRLREGRYLCDQSKLTITLVGIVFLFLIGEVPTHLASRRSAVSILYGGDPRRIDKHVMEIFRIIATLLNSISCSANFALYCLLNPRFLAALNSVLRCRSGQEARRESLKITTIKNLQSDGSCSRTPTRECPWQF